MTKDEKVILTEIQSSLASITTVLIGDPKMGTEDQGLVSRQKADEEFRDTMTKKMDATHQLVKKHDERFEEVKEILAFVRVTKWFKSKSAIASGIIVGLLGGLKTYWNELVTLLSSPSP